MTSLVFGFHNMQTTIEYGQFRLRFSASSPRAQTFLTDFLEHLPTGATVTHAETDWHLILIAGEAPMPQGTHASAVHSGSSIGTILERAWTGLEPIWKGCALLTVESGIPTGPATEFVYLIFSERTLLEVRVMLIHYLLYLKKRWLTQKGALLIHASAVARRNQGFLFLGQSGAGKTTVTELSRGIADGILHDDQVYVLRERAGYSLTGMPRSNGAGLPSFELEEDAELASEGVCTQRNNNSHVPLRAFFVLKQNDSRDQLVPLTDLSKAHALMDGFFQAAANLDMSPPILRRAMPGLAEIARRVPGFELHFRKSPDFWKLIDEQFAD